MATRKPTSSKKSQSSDNAPYLNDMPDLPEKSQDPATVHLENVSYARLSEIELWGDNYHIGDVSAIKNSILEFGYNDVLKIWRDTVMAGNHSVKALTEIKAEGKVTPKNVIVSEDGDWLIPVVTLSHLGWKEAKAFAIAHNHTQEKGHNDQKKLAELLIDIAAQDEKLLGGMGYQQTEIDAMIAKIRQQETGLTDPGRYPNAPAPLPLAPGGTSEAPAAPEPTGLNGTDLPPATVRMVQLFLSSDDYAEFMGITDKLTAQYRTSNITDTVMAALRELVVYGVQLGGNLDE